MVIETASRHSNSAEPRRNLLPVAELLLAHGIRYVPSREGSILDGTRWRGM